MKCLFIVLSLLFAIASNAETVAWPFPIVESNFRVAPLTGIKYDVSKKDKMIVAKVDINESVVDGEKRIVFNRQVIKSMKELESDTGNCSIALEKVPKLIEAIHKASKMVFKHTGSRPDTTETVFKSDELNLIVIRVKKKAHLRVQFVGSNYFELQIKHIRYFESIMNRIKLRNKL